MPPFVATLGTLGMAQGLSLDRHRRPQRGRHSPTAPRLYRATLAGMPLPVVIALADLAAFHGLLYHTRFGTYVFALGGNREALALAGVRARHSC